MTLSDEVLRRAFTGVDLPSDPPPTAEEIQAALAGDGDESSRLATLARLTATPDGRAELTMIRALRDGFAADGAAAPSGHVGAAAHDTGASLRELRRAPRWSGWAALAAAVLMVTVALVTRDSPRDDADVYRSTHGAIALVSPADGAVERGTSVFTWRHVPGASYQFELFAADGRRIARVETTDSVLTVAPPVPAGDYRWWVTARLDDATQARSAARRLIVR
jgi:hypothetical protein